MNRRKWVDIILVVLGLFVLFLMFQIFNTLKSEGTECLANGFIYGANNQLSGGGLIECSCTQARPDGEVYPFEFNNSGWRAIPVSRDIFGNLAGQ